MPTTLILGASRGIGLELARQSLAAGERVIATAGDGRSYLFHAYGLPTAFVDYTYTILAIAHIYTTADSYASTYATLGRAPTSASSLAITTAISVGSGLPIVQITGVNSTTINWRIEGHSLEL